MKTQLKGNKEKVSKKSQNQEKIFSLCICAQKPFHKWHQCSKILVKQCAVNIAPHQIKTCITLMILQ